VSGVPMRPFTRYRPTKAVDSTGGGSTYVLGTGSTLYGSGPVWENEITLVVRAESDVAIKDIVALSTNGDTGQYEVTAIREVPGSMEKELVLERLERPIHP